MQLFNKSLLILLLTLSSQHIYSQCACVWRDAGGVLQCILYSSCSNPNAANCSGQDNGTNIYCLEGPCPIYPGSSNGCAPGCFSTTSGACWYNGNTCAASTICGIILPITLASFTGEKYDKDDNLLKWTTSTEYNNSMFVLYKSTDGKTWKEAVRMAGAGNSQSELNYQIRDTDVNNIINYYKIAQVDFDGAIVQYSPIAIDNRPETRTIIKSCNLMGQEVDEYYNGLIMNYYDDGSTEKTMSAQER